VSSTEPLTADERSELEALRRRVAELDAQLVEQARRVNALIGTTQERVYWLDRWHLDLNALMARPGAAELRAAVRAVRVVLRLARKLKSRVAR
jgi:alkanesulfonate monooxygenase SsuD/methylene tetrahydromethanopterin reductase-like flavin-dependent oxidoreductase (luciferase family)